LPHLPIDTLVLIGTTADPIIRAVREGKLAVNNLLDLQGYTTEEIYGELANVMVDNVIYGVGNIHGAEAPLIEKLQSKSKTEIGGGEHVRRRSIHRGRTGRYVQCTVYIKDRHRRSRNGCPGIFGTRI